MDRDAAINALSQAGTLAAQAIGALEKIEGDAELATMHALASRLGWRLEAKLGLAPGTIVKTYDGDPKTGP